MGISVNSAFARLFAAGVWLVLPFSAQAGTVSLRYEQKVIAQPGPLPGTVVLRSLLRATDLSSPEDARRAGAPNGECFTLVRAEVDRDFSKKPVSNDEILGFSCRDIPQ